MLSLLLFSLLWTWLIPTPAWACFGGGGSSATCPNIVNIDTTFDLLRFTGQWYGIYTSNEDEAKNIKCSNIYFSQVSDGLLAFFAGKTSNLDATGSKKFTQEASMKHNFQVTNIGACGFKPSPTPMQTIVTDYQSYAMLYSCTVIGKEYVEKALVLSRTTTLADELKAKLTAGTRLQLFPLPHSGCEC